MVKGKSIDKILIYLTILSLTAILLLIFSRGELHYFLSRYVLLAVFVFNILFFITVSNYKDIKITVSTLIASFLFYGFLFYIFRSARAYFRSFSSWNSEIVGFSQYFKYPQYFDQFLFTILIISPAIIYIFFRKIYDWKSFKKKN